MPGGIGGEQIALPMRLFQLADVVEVFHRPQALPRQSKWRGPGAARHSTPAVVDALSRRLSMCSAARPLSGLASPHRRGTITAARTHGCGVRRRAEAMADFTDLRSPTRSGHSRGVADLAPTPQPRPACPTGTSPPSAGPGSSTTSACTASPRRSWTSPARCRGRSRNACGCTPITPNGCWPGRRH